MFKGDEIDEFRCEQRHFWIEILNKSYEETIKIKKDTPLGFVVIEPEQEHLKFKYETTSTKNKKKSILKTAYKPGMQKATLAVFLTVMTFPTQAENLRRQRHG